MAVLFRWDLRYGETAPANCRRGRSAANIKAYARRRRLVTFATNNKYFSSPTRASTLAGAAKIGISQRTAFGAMLSSTGDWHQPMHGRQPASLSRHV